MADGSARENNSLTVRVARYARVGRAVGGLAARVAGERYLGFKIDRGKHAAELKEALGGLKGPLMKVAQIMSTIPDVLPSEYANELAELQSNAPPMGWPFVKRRMATELGPDWQSKFATFEHKAAAAASLGQVHKATAHDGRPLACKLQYPDMASAVDADLRQLKIVFGLYERYDKAISTKHIHEELSARLRDGLGAIKGAAVQDLGRERAAIVSFTLEGCPADEVKARLAAQAVNANVSGPGSTRLDAEARGLPALVRLSPHYYNSEAEIDRVLHLIEDLV